MSSMSSARASDGTPLIPRYYAAAEHTAPHVVELRARAAADAQAGLARLAENAARQDLAAAQVRLDTARRDAEAARVRVDDAERHVASARSRLHEARERVCAHGTAQLAVAVRQWCLRAAATP